MSAIPPSSLSQHVCLTGQTGLTENGIEEGRGSGPSSSEPSQEYPLDRLEGPGVGGEEDSYPAVEAQESEESKGTPGTT